MKIRNLIVGMLFLFILASFRVEATRQQSYKFPPSEKESASTAPAKAKGVMLMNRIGPSASELYVANADGTNERKFLRKSTTGAGSGVAYAQANYQARQHKPS